ncbi:unnamed protein product [Linum trigynum]|uniref:Uncharacterized protein n=1 Tax=Linum trigynum TaxID=586398 RepID=A0AAV2D6P6_9ROSI
MPSPLSPHNFITKGNTTNTASAAIISPLLKDLLLTLPIRSFLCERATPDGRRLKLGPVSMIYFPYKFLIPLSHSSLS